MLLVSTLNLGFSVSIASGVDVPESIAKALNAAKSVLNCIATRTALRERRLFVHIVGENILLPILDVPEGFKLRHKKAIASHGGTNKPHIAPLNLQIVRSPQHQQQKKQQQQQQHK